MQSLCDGDIEGVLLVDATNTASTEKPCCWSTPPTQLQQKRHAVGRRHQHSFNRKDMLLVDATNTASTEKSCCWSTPPTQLQKKRHAVGRRHQHSFNRKDMLLVDATNTASTEKSCCWSTPLGGSGIKKRGVATTHRCILRCLTQLGFEASNPHACVERSIKPREIPFSW